MMPVTDRCGAPSCTQLHTYRFILGSNIQRDVPVSTGMSRLSLLWKLVVSGEWLVGENPPATSYQLPGCKLKIVLMITTYKVSNTVELNFNKDDSLRSAAFQRPSWCTWGAGTTTHFMRAALAAIIPLKESSKQIQVVGGTLSSSAQFKNTCGCGLPWGRCSAEVMAFK